MIEVFCCYHVSEGLKYVLKYQKVKEKKLRRYFITFFFFVTRKFQQVI